MFSKFNNLLLRDKLHIANVRKISQSKTNLYKKSFVHKNFILNCLAYTHLIDNYLIEIQSVIIYNLSLNKRLLHIHIN